MPSHGANFHYVLDSRQVRAAVLTTGSDAFCGDKNKDIPRSGTKVGYQRNWIVGGCGIQRHTITRGYPLVISQSY